MAQAAQAAAEVARLAAQAVIVARTMSLQASVLQHYPSPADLAGAQAGHLQQYPQATPPQHQPPQQQLYPQQTLQPPHAPSQSPPGSNRRPAPSTSARVLMPML